MSGHAGSGRSVTQEGGQAMRERRDGGGEAADFLSAAEADALHRVFLEACHLATNHKSNIADVPVRYRQPKSTPLHPAQHRHHTK